MPQSNLPPTAVHICGIRDSEDGSRRYSIWNDGTVTEQRILAYSKTIAAASVHHMIEAAPFPIPLYRELDEKGKTE